MHKVHSVVMMNAQTTTGVSAKHHGHGVYHTFQVTGTTTSGSGSATVVVQVSNVLSPGTSETSSDWLTLNSFAVSVTDENTPAVGSYVSTAPWLWYRVRVSAISGTGTSITVRMGC